MARAHGVLPDGTAVDLIGQPLHLRPGPAPGIQFGASDTMTKATYDGVYTLDGHRFLMRAGQALPPGAVPEPLAVSEPEPAPAKRSRGAAPENRAKAEEPETT